MRTFHPERNIEFDECGDMEAFADEGRISQVFSNLIGNALQYGVKNQPILVTLTSTSENIVITVNNQGDPIDPQKLATIFEPMVRLANLDRAEYTRDKLRDRLFYCKGDHSGTQGHHFCCIRQKYWYYFQGQIASLASTISKLR